MVLMVAAFMLGCNNSAPTADEIEQNKQEGLQKNITDSVGMPGILKYTEKRLARQLYELRDKVVLTYTYLPDINGKLHHVCDSIGFGLPYATQFSSPSKMVEKWRHGNLYRDVLPQAEPNGLFMPTSANGTWAICISPKGMGVPFYVEPSIISAPVELNAVDEYMKDPNQMDNSPIQITLPDNVIQKLREKRK